MPPKRHRRRAGRCGRASGGTARQDRGLLRNPRRIARPELELAEKDQSELEKIIVLLRAQTSHDFSLYKKSTLYRRIELRMGLHQLARIKDYVRCLRENPHESELDGALNFN